MRISFLRAALIFGAAFFFFSSCDINDTAGPEENNGLKLLGEYSLEVPEPSGLTLNGDRDALWTVSDNTYHVYKISLDGRLLDELNFNGNDLEGVTFDSTDNTLWIVEEQLREIVHLSLSGAELERFNTDLAGSGNSGLEGICLDDEESLYLLNEKEPALWAKLKSDFKVELQEEIPEAVDLSGICYDAENSAFWIVSDQAKKVIHWSPASGLIKAYDLPFEKAEGVAYDPLLGRLYIVSDLTGKLYVYEIL
jgi:uncharacterized protein YjiK